MTKRSLALLLGFLISAPAAAQTEPAEVTDADIAKYRALAASSCQEAGTKQGDPKEKVTAFCDCLMLTINKTMTRGDWQRAYFYSLKGQSRDERQVLEPHLRNGTVCRVPASTVEQPADAQPAPEAAQPAQKAAPAQPKASQGLRPPAAK